MKKTSTCLIQCCLLLALAGSVFAQQDRYLSFADTIPNAGTALLANWEKNNTLFVVGEDKILREYDPVSFRLKFSWRFETGVGNAGQLRCLDFGPQGKLFAIGLTGNREGWNAKIMLCDFASRQIVDVIEEQPQSINVVMFAPTRPWLYSACEGKTLLIWDYEKRSTVRKIELDSAARFLKFTEAGDVLVGHESGRLTVMDHQTLEAKTSFRAHQSKLMGLQVGKGCIFTAAIDGTIKKWDANGKQIQSIVPKQSAAISFIVLDRNRDNLCYGTGWFGSMGMLLNSSYQPEVGIISADAMRVTRKMEWPSSRVARVMPGATGSSWLAADVVGNLIQFEDGQPAKLVLGCRSKPLNSLRFVHDQSRFQTAIGWTTRYDPQVNNVAPDHWFDLKSLDFVDQRLNQDKLEDRSFLGQRLDVAREAYRKQQWALQPERIRAENSEADLLLLYEGSNYKGEFFMVPQSRYLRMFNAFVTKRDEAWIATETGLYIFDPTTGQETEKIEAQASGVTRLSRSADQRFMLAYGSDRILNIFNLQTRELVFSLFFADGEWAAWTPQGYYDCSAGGERLVGWHVNRGTNQLAEFQPLENFYQEFHRPELMRRLWEMGSVERALSATEIPAIQVDNFLAPHVDVVIDDEDVYRDEHGAAFDYETRDADLKLKIIVSAKPNSRINEVAVKLNGRFPTVLATGINQAQYETEAEVRLGPGIQDVTILVKSDQGIHHESRPLSVLYRSTDLVTPARKLHVLSFGIDRYKDPREFATLCTAGSRALQVREQLIEGSQGLFQSCDAIEISRIVPKTKNDVFAEFDRIKQDMQPNDMVVLYWGGHGMEVGQGRARDFYFVLPDCSKETLTRNGLSAGDLSTELSHEKFNGVRVVLFIDSCHAGRALEILRDVVRENGRSDGAGIITIAASCADEEADDALFGEALLRGLKGHRETVIRTTGNARPIVVVDKLSEFIRRHVLENSGGQQRPMANGLSDGLIHQLAVATEEIDP